MFQKIWDFCGEVKVNFWLLLLISANLGIGSYYLKFNFTFFNPLNQMLIQEWVQQVGRSQINQLWWLGSLILLLFFLGVNTVVCALKRLIHLWPLRRQIGVRTFSVPTQPFLDPFMFPGHPFRALDQPGRGLQRGRSEQTENRYPASGRRDGPVDQSRLSALSGSGTYPGDATNNAGRFCCLTPPAA